jgi:archaeosine-15-forming tRNA-guanine transglycosylase
MVLSNIDKDIYRPVVEALRDFNMEFSDDESIKGDSLVQVSGALSQIVNEQNTQRIMQLLQTTANPLDAQVVGPEERAVMLREVAKITGLPKDSVVKSDDEIKAAKETQQAEEQQALIAQGQQTQGVG